MVAKKKPAAKGKDKMINDLQSSHVELANHLRNTRSSVEAKYAKIAGLEAQIKGVQYALDLATSAFDQLQVDYQNMVSQRDRLHGYIQRINDVENQRLAPMPDPLGVVFTPTHDTPAVTIKHDEHIDTFIADSVVRDAFK